MQRTRVETVIAVAAAIVTMGCTGTVDFHDDGDGAPSGGDAGAVDADTSGGPDAATADATPSGPDAAPGTCDNITGDRQQQVCLRWSCDRQALGEGGWSGNLASCNAGDTTAGGRDRALRLINMYRFIAQLPPVTTDATKNARAQKCALMMDANNSLSHDPPTSWTCYSADGASGAGTSNIASAPGVLAVDMYMNDFGNATTIGHRRWLLSNGLGPIGLGSTEDASCALVLGGNGSAGKPWMAWPPVGPVPLEAFTAGGFGQSLDESGWTVQSDSLDLDASGVDVSVSEGGQDRPVTTNVLGAGYGSATAIRFVPDGWSAQAGHTYRVTVTGLSTPITYDVEVVDCP